MELSSFLKVPGNPKFRPNYFSLYVLTIVWLYSILSVEGESYTYYTSAGDNGGPTEHHKLNTMVKDYIKLLDRMKAGQHPGREISGQVNLRAPRSELVGDMAHALRLYQLHELDRMYGSKSRPRFGKRNSHSSSRSGGTEMDENLGVDGTNGGEEFQGSAMMMSGGGSSSSGSSSSGGGDDDMISGGITDQ